MAEEDDASKTEDPTSKKLTEARSEGQVAQSMEVKTWAMFLGASLLMVTIVPYVMDGVRRSLVVFLESPHAISVDSGHLQVTMFNTLQDLGVYILPLFAFFVLVALAGAAGQVGMKLSPKLIKPKTQKISVISGFKRIFSMKQVLEFVKGLVKVSIVAALAITLVIPFLDDLPLLPEFDLHLILDRMWLIAILLIVSVTGIMTVIAALDFVYQRHSFTKKMRMTKQEVKDEHKQAEGDPAIKAKLKGIRMQRARTRMMAAVPEADVIITNPTHYAVALTYKLEEMQAPRLVAKGVDHLAFRIREIAEENDVPVVENPPLARALYATVELDQDIPYEHYKAVAEIIAYVMGLKGQRPS
ncbi:MAG: flagellar biosynthesis protein FlhB [Rhodospirillales bacterium]|nr:flagellar biosynthesis protein FlhB [Rhodospirillales bacterium]MCW8861052.1 flagellar biosynthesis protein FlhB [Rhodospirillales bacterium]MCW8953060.1 flagellar biosynthesis protein FlhB [Rhodospirillales bacterium]MCW8970692.1 flagellar biosynthesis protein FlhB [Rhodospirillales bacterium]MCW9003475.1 flagellar biosynthesis protein FlhB [Rhodospirillales bacterium]